MNAYLGMDELDCTDRQQYIEKAVALAEQPAKLAVLKELLRNACKTNSFFDTQFFVQGLERALHIAWNRHVADQLASDINVH